MLTPFSHRNDEILTQGGRVRTWDDGKGRHTLTILQVELIKIT